MSYENCHNLNPNDIKPSEIIEDYLDLIRCSQPYCNCGKCIIRKYSHHPTNYQYEKNLRSSYKNEFNWKQPEDKSQGLDGKKHIIQNLGLDKCFKEHLKTSLISVMKNDYSKNLKLKEDLVLNNYKNQKEKVTKNNDNADLTVKIVNNNNGGNNKNCNSTAMRNSLSRNKDSSNGLQGLNNTKTNDFNSSNKNSNSIYNSGQNENKDGNSIIKNDSYKNLNKTNESIISRINQKEKTSLTKNPENSHQNLDNELNNKTLHPPFIGRSSYELMYPDWQTAKVVKENVGTKKFESVPFNARSSYQDNFHPHDKRYYLDRPAPIIKLDNLESSGKLTNETTAKQTYKPIDYNNYKELNKKEINVSKRPSSIVAAPYSKDSFLSSYERAFMYNNLSNKSNLRSVNRSVFY